MGSENLLSVENNGTDPGDYLVVSYNDQGRGYLAFIGQEDLGSLQQA